MNAKFKTLLEELEKANVKDAVQLLVAMLGGPEVTRDMDPASGRGREFGESIHKLAKIGLMAVMCKQDLIGVLRESGEGTDDTMLEDQLITMGGK